MNTSPGKFESEPDYAEHFWTLVVEGEGEVHGAADGYTYTAIEVTPEDRATFSELDATSDFVVLWETDSGFVWSRQATVSEWEDFKIESESFFCERCRGTGEFDETLAGLAKDCPQCAGTGFSGVDPIEHHEHDVCSICRRRHGPEETHPCE